MGIKSNEKRNVNMTFNAATIPNSTNSADPVNANTPKPMDVVKLAKNKVLPTLLALSIKETSLFCVMRYVSWYLFSKNIVFGTPITTINGGIKPESNVILNPKRTIVARDATIPIKTTISAKNTT